MGFLSIEVYGNSLMTWISALLVFLLVFIFLKLLQRFLLKRISALAERTKTDIDDLVAQLIEGTKFFFLFVVSLYVGALLLEIPESTQLGIRTFVLIILFIQVGLWGNLLVTFYIRRRVKEEFEEEDAAGATTIDALGIVVKGVLWAIIVVLILDNIPGVEVTSLIASLGIGGIAVALAVQNVLGDLFASLSIALDKPFVVGDFIIIDDYIGTVEKIGLKSTRVRSLSGEQLIFSNNDLLNSRIRNYKRMAQRRVVFNIGVTYQAPSDKLEAIPDIIKEIIESQELTTFDRAHFKDYGDFSLNYEIVYHVQSAEYNDYMDIQQTINLEIYRKFEEQGIDFAYPTQTVFVENPN